MQAWQILFYYYLLLLCRAQSTDPIDAHIERPCEVFDRFCIRQFLARHSRCQPVDRAVPDPIYLGKTTAYVPHANASFTPSPTLIYGLNGRIEEFYINRVTDKLLIAVDFTGIQGVANYTYVRFYRRAQEPLEYINYASVTFPSVAITITIPNLKDLRLDRSEVFAYAAALPVLVIGPGPPTEGVDAQVLESVAAVYGNLPATAAEFLLNLSPFYISSFIQYALCDFGVELI